VKKLLQSNRGAAAVEFALLGPLVIMIVTMIVELGRMGLVFYSLTDSTQRAAREAMVSSTNSGRPHTMTSLQTLVRSRVTGVAANSVMVTVNYVSGSNLPGTEVVITSSVNFRPLNGLLGSTTVPMRTQARQIITF
jgi:Flp pilus assembly protein TadG